MSSELESGLIVAGCVAVLGWGTWVTVSVMGYNKKIEEATDIKKDFEALEKRVIDNLASSEQKHREMEDRVTISLDNFDKTLHIWKNTMIDELKSAFKNVRFNRGGQRTSE